MQMRDVHAIDSGDTDTMLLLVVLHPLAKVLVGLLRIAVVAAAITAGPSVLVYELQCDIEIVRSDVLAQDKAVAVTEQNHSPDNIGFVFDKHTSCKKIKPTHSFISQVAGGLFSSLKGRYRLSLPITVRTINVYLLDLFRLFQNKARGSLIQVGYCHNGPFALILK